MTMTQVLSLYIDDHLFGIDICAIQDVLRRVDATSVPLAGERVAGLINLRGHIVTLLHVDRCLQLMHNDHAAMNVVIEHRKELFGLLFDRIGDIQEIDMRIMENVPPTLAQPWHDLCDGVCRLPEGLMMILNPLALIESATVQRQLPSGKEGAIR